MSTVGRRAGAAGGARRELTPTTLARITGALYLLVIALGLFCELGVRGRLIVAGDVDATARNIHAYESLWRISIGAEVLLLLAATAMVPLMFVLFRPVNRLLTLAATAFDLVSLAVEASIAMFLLAALFPLRDAPYLREVDPHVTHAMMRVALSLHAHGFGLALAFFGCWCVIVGVMIARSRLVPRPIGLLMQLAGGCYLTNSFALIVAPALADRLFPFVLLPCFVAEAAFALWLTLRGIDESRFVALAERGARTDRRA